MDAEASAPPLRAIDWPLGAGSALGAALVAAVALRRRPSNGPAASRLAAAIERVRDLHSGRIGDYVTWLVAGAAVLGALVALVAA
jgi:hypothetical protein